MSNMFDNIQIRYQYKCGKAHLTNVTQWMSAPDPDVKKVKCGEKGCKLSVEYIGFEPIKMNITEIVHYERNGRLAVRVTDKKGKVSHVSKSKLHYKKTGRIENQYSESYRQHLMKTDQQALMTTETNIRRAKAQPLSKHVEQMDKIYKKKDKIRKEAK